TLADEQQTILGHRCQKATCRFRGRDFVAWFATDVPIKGGPWKFGGLPGCILKVYDVQKIYVWEAVAIERGTYQIMQYPDKLYPKSTRKSVWQRQIKYNEDYWNAIGWTSLEGRPTPPKVPFEPLEKE
ncbi:MAG: GLPGLI family protein, partial [Bacteroidaceae bacterium]|nr:GLPGLI family protein [Bacteroidaceae bacterium]